MRDGQEIEPGVDDFESLKRRVFNIASMLRVSWQNVADVSRGIGLSRLPLNGVIWYPGGSPKSSRWVLNVCVVLLHYIPAIILDSLIILTGNKPVLWNIQNRITKGFELLEFYTTNEWEFINANCIEAKETLNETERRIYNFDIESLNLDDYCYDCIYSARLYLLKESDESIPTAKRHLKIMWAVDWIFKLLLLSGFLYLLMKYIICPVIGIDF